MGPISASKGGEQKARWFTTPERSLWGKISPEKTLKGPGEADKSSEKPWFLAISTVKALIHTQGFYWVRETG